MHSNKRCLVIELSLIFEGLVSQTLCTLLNIDITKTKAFGNGSESLSFAQKLTILSDLDVFNKKEKLSFKYFSEIRNQFAHNQSAIDFASCFAFIHMESQLAKLFKSELQKTDNQESKCENLFFALFSNLTELTTKLITVSVKKSYLEGLNGFKTIYFDNLFETLNNNPNYNKELYDQMSKIFIVANEKTQIQAKAKAKEKFKD